MKLEAIKAHIETVSKHKAMVLKLCVKAGIPLQGLTHDLSKFSPTEFFESVKYYTGTSSPINGAREAQGFSHSWLHHKGRNRHHFEYWYDPAAKNPTPVIPYNYAVEMACDQIAASVVYGGENWKPEHLYEFYIGRKDRYMLNRKIDNFLVNVYAQIVEKGIDSTINEKNLKALYKKCVNTSEVA